MLAKGSIPWILTTFGITVCFALAACFTGLPYAKTGVAIGLLALVFFFVFFRDPERYSIEGEECMLSPADGRIVDIRNRKLCIFMNFQNVHVNRAPLKGKVTFMEYKKGGYIPAFCKDSHRNERHHIFIDTEHGKVEVVQIAGTITRRIVPYIKEGDMMEKGQRIGMIRFGSRVDVTVPDNFVIECNKGDKVYAGRTAIARLKQKE
ncbi:phosphatidylserine decarboxylase [Methanomethylovorans sp.]|uniref:phosphatidylserine decarboxylase n=1 Tax=Methanomethylovorans sp. TaxID=2758717 RepID=UPI00351C72AD